MGVQRVGAECRAGGFDTGLLYHIAHIAHIARTRGTVGVQRLGVALSLEGVSKMDRLLALVRPGNDLVLRRIRSLKRCVEACGCKIMTPRYAPQFGSRLHFKRCQALPKETPFPFFFWDPCFLFFFFLSPAKVGSLEMQPGAKLQAYLGVIILQPHACTQRFRLRILRRTRSFPGRTSARSLSGRIESIWETHS